MTTDRRFDDVKAKITRAEAHMRELEEKLAKYEKDLSTVTAEHQALSEKVTVLEGKAQVVEKL